MVRLGLLASSAGGMGSILARGTKVPYAMWTKKKKKEERSRDRVWRLNEFVPCPHPRGAEKAYVTGIRRKLFYFLVCTMGMTAVTFSQGRVRNAVRLDK